MNATDVSSKGKIVSLQLCSGYRKPMQFVDKAEAVENLGFKGDRHALTDSSRQVLLIEKETLDNIGLKPGEVKENITTIGINLMRLQHRTRLKIGGEVLLEITKPCSPCSRMDEIRKGLIQDLARRRGMLTRVVKGGVICHGDTIEVIED